MTDDLFRPPFGGENRDDERAEALPAHEQDTDTSVGGGLMSSGATATDRGTGELDGIAQGPEADDDEDDVVGVNEGGIAGLPAGGAQPYIATYVEDDDREGGALPDA